MKKTKKAFTLTLSGVIIFIILAFSLYMGVTIFKDSKNEKIITEKKSISLITDRSDFHLKNLAAKYERENNVKINISGIEKGLLNKIETRKNEADMYISKNSSEIIIAANKDLLAELPKVITDKLDKLHKGKEWINMSFRDRAFYIKKGVTDFPKTYEALADEKYKGRICIRPLTHNYNIELISYIYAKHGKEYTKEWLKGLKNNLARTPVGNDRNQVKGVYEGVCDIAVANSYYMGLMLDNPKQRAWAANVNMFFPNQDVKDNSKLDGVVSLFSAIGVNKNTENKEEVYKFINYILDPSNQQFMSATNYEYPIIGHAETKMIKSFGTMQGLEPDEIKVTKITQEEISKIRNDVIKLITETK